MWHTRLWTFFQVCKFCLNSTFVGFLSSYLYHSCIWNFPKSMLIVVLIGIHQALLHWLFCGNGWNVDLVMVSWTRMLLVLLFVIWVLRIFLITDLYVTCLLSSSWCFKLYVKTSNDVNVTTMYLDIWFAALGEF